MEIDLKNSINQLVLQTFTEHPTPMTAYILFSGTHRMFFRTDQTVGHTTNSLNLEWLKSHKLCSPTTMEWKYKSVQKEIEDAKIKQHPSKKKVYIYIYMIYIYI